jgi:hypothetical protein
MYMRLVVYAKQQKPMARPPGPLLRLAARVVHACLVRQYSVPFLQDKKAYWSTQCLTSYSLCSRGRTMITNLETPLVLLALCPVTKGFTRHAVTACDRGSNVCLVLANLQKRGLSKS